MKLLIILLFSIFSYTNLQSQITLVGKVIDSSSGKELEYASVGVVNSTFGTITNEVGKFDLNIKMLEKESIVRFSMIGYEPLTMTIGDLVDRDNIIKLNQKPIQLNEIFVTPNNAFRKIGITSHPIIGQVCGWGGDKRGKGHEIGSKFDLGNSVTKIQEIHFYIRKQSYDNILLRLHIRNIKGGVPDKELINDNIFIATTKSSGWVNFDLSKYDLFLNGEVAVTLEWINVFGVNKKKMVKMNAEKQASSVILFSTKKGLGCTYSKRGVEAKWSKTENVSPCIYLRVQ